MDQTMAPGRLDQTGHASAAPWQGFHDLVGLGPLMAATPGRSEVGVGLIDGPVTLDHPDLAVGMVRQVARGLDAACELTESYACLHGTFVAGILAARRDTEAPGICPGCMLLVRPIFAELAPGLGIPVASPRELAAAVTDAVDAGARVLNVSASLAASATEGLRNLNEALDYAALRGTLVVVAAGNQGKIGGTELTRHPWVIAVAACDRRGRPLGYSNLGAGTGARGLLAPGDSVTSLGAMGGTLTWSGTSAAAPFVAGTIALLISLFPRAAAEHVRFALRPASAVGRTIVPPLLDATAAYRTLARART